MATGNHPGGCQCQECQALFAQLGMGSQAGTSTGGGNTSDSGSSNLVQALNNLAQALGKNTEATVKNPPSGSSGDAEVKKILNEFAKRDKDQSKANDTVKMALAKAQDREIAASQQKLAIQQQAFGNAIKTVTGQFVGFSGALADSYKNFAQATRQAGPLTEALARRDAAAFGLSKAAANGQAGVIGFQADLLNAIPKSVAELGGTVAEIGKTLAPALQLAPQIATMLGPQAGRALGRAGVYTGAGIAGVGTGLVVGNFLNQAINPGAKEQGLGDVFDTVKKMVALGAGGAAGAVTLDQGKGQGVVGALSSMLGLTKNNGSDLQSLWADLTGDKTGAAALRAKNQRKDQAEDLKSGQEKFKELLKAPSTQGMLKGLQLQRDETEAGFQNQKIDLYKGFYRQQEDLEKDHNRTLQDLGTQQFRFQRDQAIELNRMNEDFALSKQKLTIQSSRIEQDASTQAFRTQRDHMLNLRDFKIQEQRQDQDFARASGRLDVTQGRAERDLNKQGQAIDLAASRSRQDLNTSYSDSLLSILAPGAFNSKGMQLMRLNRDFTKANTRLNEDVSIQQRDLRDRRKDTAQDYQFEREGLNLGYSRGKQDLANSKQREQISFQDSMFDQQKALTRSRQDLAMQQFELERGFTRGLQDMNKAISDFNQDFNKQYSRTQQDYTIAKSRSVQDFAESNRRLGQSEEFAQRGQQLQFAQIKEQLLKDANIARGTGAYDTASKDLDRLLNSTGGYRFGGAGGTGGSTNTNLTLNPVFQLPQGSSPLSPQQEQMIQQMLNDFANQMGNLLSQTSSRTR